MESDTTRDPGRDVERGGGHDRFEHADLETLSRPRWTRWLQPGLAGAVFLSLVASALHALRTGRAVVALAGTEVAVLDLLYVVALAFVAVVLLPKVVANPGRVRRLLGRLRDRPLVAVAAAYAGSLFLAGSLYPLLVPEPELHVLISGQPPAWLSVSESLVPTCHGPTVEGRCRGTLDYPLGTNARGQDLLTVGLFGLHTSLQVAVVASVIAVTLGVLVGTVAGYFGGRPDELLMRFVDVQRALPAFFVYVLLVFVVGRSYVLLTLVLGFLSWGGIARVVRSEVRQLRTAPFVKAARLSGASSWGVIGRQVLPNAANAVVPAAGVLFAKFVIYEASLAFLSLTESSVRSLGSEIAVAVGSRTADPVQPTGPPILDWWLAPWVVVVPAGILCTFLLAVSVCSDGLRDVVDPR